MACVIPILRLALPQRALSQAAEGKTSRCCSRSFINANQEVCICALHVLSINCSSNRTIQTIIPETEVCIGVVSTRCFC